MHDRIKPLRRKHGIERGAIANVSLDQWSPAHRLAMTEHEVVEYDTLMSRCGERFGAMATDIAGTTCDEYTCHGERNYRKINARIAKFAREERAPFIAVRAKNIQPDSCDLSMDR